MTQVQLAAIVLALVFWIPHGVMLRCILLTLASGMAVVSSASIRLPQ